MHTGREHPRDYPGTKTSLRPPTCWTIVREDGWVLGCSFSGRLRLVLCLWRTNGNASTWAIFSPLVTPALVQKAGAAPAPTPIVLPEEPDAAAQELGLACTAPPITEAHPPA